MKSVEVKKPMPFLKWAGGKRWLIEKHADIFPPCPGNYIEPFLGAGSVFFHLRPAHAYLSDTNLELIETYKAIRDNWRLVLKHLKRHRNNHSDSYYYELRSFSPKTLATKGARFIYLNRTCFNGIYRVNRQGKFNVPRGTRNSVIFKTDDFEALSEVFQNVELNACDFEESIDRADNGDLVFADPPYTVRHNNNAFVKYNEKLFSWDDQIRLANSLKKAANRGAKVIATNAYHPCVIELYQGFFDLRPICRKSQISADRQYRGNFLELLIQRTK